MFAAATIRFHAPLLIGADALQTSRIVDISCKSGRSGALVFVEIERTLVQHGTVRVVEQQSYVYRGGDEPAPLPQPTADDVGGELWHPGAVNLFRFSAATFNGHRIHYDLSYARDVEGYPALVVHGPFTAAKLAEIAGRCGPLASFSFRARAPLFVDQPIRLQADADMASAIRCDGVIAMTAAVIYR